MIKNNSDIRCSFTDTHNFKYLNYLSAFQIINLPQRHANRWLLHFVLTIIHRLSISYMIIVKFQIQTCSTYQQLQIMYRLYCIKWIWSISGNSFSNVLKTLKITFEPNFTSTICIETDLSFIKLITNFLSHLICMTNKYVLSILYVIVNFLDKLIFITRKLYRSCLSNIVILNILFHL